MGNLTVGRVRVPTNQREADNLARYADSPILPEAFRYRCAVAWASWEAEKD